MFLVSAQRTGCCMYHLSWTAWGTSDVIWIRGWRPVTWGIRAAGSVKCYREAMEGATDVRHSNSIEMEAKCYWEWAFCCSAAKSWSTLCNPMNCSMPGSSFLHYPPEFAQTQSIESVVPSNRLILYCRVLLHPLIFPRTMVFSNKLALWSSGQSIGASASAAVLPMNTQNWFPLGWTGWISLQSKRLSRVFSNTTVQKHQFFRTQLSFFFLFLFLCYLLFIYFYFISIYFY